MAFLTAAQLYQLLIDAELPDTVRTEVRQLERKGHFSAAAQAFIHRLQADPDVRDAFIQTPQRLLSYIDGPLEGFEYGLMLVVAYILNSRIQPGKNFTLMFMPDRDEARRRFHGQRFNFDTRRQSVIDSVLAEISDDDLAMVLDNPRLLLKKEGFNADGIHSPLPSVITSKAANGYHFKSGQRKVPGT